MITPTEAALVTAFKYILWKWVDPKLELKIQMVNNSTAVGTKWGVINYIFTNQSPH